MMHTLPVARLCIICMRGYFHVRSLPEEPTSSVKVVQPASKNLGPTTVQPRLLDGV